MTPMILEGKNLSQARCADCDESWPLELVRYETNPDGGQVALCPRCHRHRRFMRWLSRRRLVQRLLGLRDKKRGLRRWLWEKWEKWAG